MRDKTEERGNKLSREVLEYQPDAVEIEERPVAGRIRWVLYLILGTIIVTVVGAVIFKVDRFVVAQGRLITTSPTIVVQSLNTAVVHSIDVRVGDVVEHDQVLVTLDPTFASADLTQLSKKSLALGVQIRRMQAELQGRPFSARPEEAEDGRLQEQIFSQRRMILDRNKRLADDKIAALRSKLSLNAIQRQGQEQQLKLLRDVEGTTAMRPQTDNDYRLRLLEAQKARTLAASAIDNLKGEEQVTINELKQAESDWQRFVVEREGQLMEQEVQLRNDLEKVLEDYNKARRMHELVLLRSPQKGIVLKIAERSVGSILQPAEPIVTLVPFDSDIEVEVDVPARDIGRIRVDDPVRVKLDAFPFQRHDTLPGRVRVISEDAFQNPIPGQKQQETAPEQELVDAFYRSRINLLSSTLRDVPDGFRLMPGMKVRAEIKVGRRTVISYFLYPVIRALDESLREP
jgi:hemolysin D